VVRVAGGAANGDSSGSVAADRVHGLLRSCVRVARIGRPAAVAPMRPAPILRTTVLVALFEPGRLGCFLAQGEAALRACSR
jgi:hypothetical protein